MNDVTSNDRTELGRENISATKATLPPDLARTLVGGMTEQRIQNPRRDPLSGELYLNFYLDDERLAAAREFLGKRPLAIEVGFGHGHFLSQRAADRPDLTFVGFELRRKWCEELKERALEGNLTNLRIVHDDARAVLARFLDDGALHELYVNFPDPWWKRKHQRRRLMAPPFVALAHRKLEIGGRLLLKTDVLEYAKRSIEALRAHGGFEIGPLVSAGELGLPLTYREKRYRRTGEATFGLVAEKRDFTR